MKLLIAEFGNNHLGDITKAKEYIRVAKESGATHAKGQAFIAKDISGSMPYSFYNLCQLRFQEYVELIDYGNEIGIPVFFSIFSRELEPLVYHQQWYKIAGSQSKLNFSDLWKKDTYKTIVSVPEMSIKPRLERSYILHVTPYCSESANLEQINFLSMYYDRPAGLSCHSIGIKSALEAINKYDVPILEKHLTLTRDIKFNGQVFRDAIHAVMPNELEILAKELRK